MNRIQEYEWSVEYRQPPSLTWIISIPAFFFLLLLAPILLRQFDSEVIFGHWLIALFAGLIAFGWLCSLISFFTWNFVRYGCRADRIAREITIDRELLIIPFFGKTVSVGANHSLVLHGIVHTRNDVRYRTDYYCDLYQGNRYVMRVGRSQDDKDSVVYLAISLAKALNISAWDGTYAKPELLQAGQREFEMMELTCRETMDEYEGRSDEPANPFNFR